jgi:hypothetical protein
MDLNYNILELIFNYLDKNDKLKLINSNVFIKDLCFDQLMILYKYIDKKNKMLKIMRSDCTQIHNNDPISNSKQLYVNGRVCDICNTWTPHSNASICIDSHTICDDCDYNDWFDICIKCKQTLEYYDDEKNENEDNCVICILSKCGICVNELIELLIRID